MFIRSSKPGKPTLTFIFYLAVVLALSVCLEAKGLHLQHRDHTNLKRLIKKRAPPLVPLIGAGAAAPTFTSTDTTTVTSPTPSATQSITSETASAPEATKATTTSDSSSSTTLDSSSTSQTSSSTSTSTSTTESTTTNPSTSNEPLRVTSAPDVVSAPPPKSTVTQTESVDPTTTSSSTPLAQSSASKTKSTTLTVVIVIGSCIAGIAILWTVFRKWKLGRSSKFDERLQPIDWHPTNVEAAGQRRFSTGASSFHSGTGHGSSTGHGAGGYGGSGGSDHGHDGSGHVHSYGVPDHDFTAGPATLAPVGGYADLARGSSPLPHMHQVTRSPSLTRPAYDVGVPLHHQTGYSAQDVYGGPRY